jgi:hypothetical protein
MAFWRKKASLKDFRTSKEKPNGQIRDPLLFSVLFLA